MLWTMLLAAFALHVVCAALIMRQQARRVCNWRISIFMALSGQLAISVASLATGMLCVVLAGEMGLPTSRSLYALGAFAAAISWSVALKGLVTWMAQRAKGAFYSPATMRRVSTRSFLYVLGCYGGAVVLGFGAWRTMNPPLAGIFPGARFAAMEHAAMRRA
ncbi:MAG: hypothetical protein JWN73_4848 [Betaproteobacteria bacterium]|nr:hypothetical protein [Betaproteobacteria bacterium]